MLLLQAKHVPIFEELSHKHLLKKCLHRLTQNQNESFNVTIWDRIPKSRYVSFLQLQFGVFDAVTNFNIGRKVSILVYEKIISAGQPAEETIPAIATVAQRERVIPLGYRKRLTKHLEELRSNDVIEGPLGGDEFHEWVSNLIITEKKFLQAIQNKTERVPK